MISRVIIDPGHGRNVHGFYDAGAAHEGLIEAELTFQLARYIEDGLKRSGIRCFRVETMQGGRPEEFVNSTDLVIELHFDDRSEYRPKGVVYHNGPGTWLLELAEELADCVAVWGKRSTKNYHSCGVFELSKELDRGICPHLYVSAFSLKSLDAVVCSQRIKELGELLAVILARTAVTQNPGTLTHCPLTAQQGAKPSPAAGLENLMGPSARRDSQVSTPKSAGAQSGGARPQARSSE